jgi:hypothetical protein
MSGASLDGDTRLSARYERRRRAFNSASARSTLLHEVFWVRIAPTHTSKAVVPGHHPACPYRRLSRP